MKLFGLSTLCIALSMTSLSALANITEFDRVVMTSKTHHSQIIEKDNTFAIQDNITGEILTPFYKEITCWTEQEPCKVEQKTDKTVRYNGEEFPTYTQGVIDWRGKTIIKPDYESVYIRRDGYILVANNDNDTQTYALFDQKGKEIIPFSKRYIGHFSEGVATFFVDDDSKKSDTAQTSSRKYGLMDIKGKELIAAKYDNLNPSNFGLLHAELFDKKTNEIKNGFIDKHDNIKIPFIYQDAETFNELGLARVVMDTKVGFINTKGKAVLPIIYDTALVLGKNRFLVKKDDKYGIVDDKNKPVIALEYDKVQPIPSVFLSENENDKGILVIFEKDNTAMVTDQTGKIIVKPSSDVDSIIEQLEKLYSKSK